MNNINLFLDSGAFSAWTQGIEINIHTYIDFIKQHQNHLEIYANLDVIGIGGKQPNRLTAEKTLENQRFMEKAGLNPLPCFHFGEPFEYLQHYVNNYDYMALGGLVGKPIKSAIPWLDVCFGDFICTVDGWPRIRVHGFGLTNLSPMLRYPWYSVDSTSWILTSRMGSIFVPRYRDDKWIYDENSWKISVSARSPDKKEAGQHIDTLSLRQRAIILDYIHTKRYGLGKSRFEQVLQSHELTKNECWAEKKPKDPASTRLLEIIEEDGLCNCYHLRDEMNIIYFQDLEKSMPEWPWTFKRSGFKGAQLL